MYRDIEHTSRYLHAHRLAEAEPSPRRRRRLPQLIVGTLLVRVGERLVSGIETPVGSRV